MNLYLACIYVNLYRSKKGEHPALGASLLATRHLHLAGGYRWVASILRAVRGPNHHRLVSLASTASPSHDVACPVAAAPGARTHDTGTSTVRAARSATARTNTPTRVSHPDCPRARSAAGHQGFDELRRRAGEGATGLPAGAGRVRAHAPVVDGLVVERLVRN